MVYFNIPNFKPTHTLTDFEFLHDPRSDNMKLGNGSFAAVRLAQEKKSGKLVALKTIELNNITETDLHNLKSEILIHKDLDHPNIIKFHGYIQDDDLVYIVLDYANNGNLFNYLQCKRKLTEKEVFRFFHQTCLATNYLHQHNILHRDIKPENLLLDQDFNIKVCDFGWSAYNIHQRRSTFCGTYEYMAPEIIREQAYDYRVDIWALGVLLFELIHNRPPYKGMSLPEIKSSLSKNKVTYDEKIHHEIRKLIPKILDHDPNSRIGIDQILSCPWINEHIEREINFRRSVYQGDAIGRATRFNNINQKMKIFDDSSEPQPIVSNNSSSKIAQEIQTVPTKLELYETEKDSNPQLYRKRISTVASLYSIPTDLHCDIRKTKSKQPSSLASILTQEKPGQGQAPKKRIFDENLLSPTFSSQLEKVLGSMEQIHEYNRKTGGDCLYKKDQNRTMRTLTEFAVGNNQTQRVDTVLPNEKRFNQNLLGSIRSGFVSQGASPRELFENNNTSTRIESKKTLEKIKNSSFIKDVRSFFEKVHIPSCRRPQI